MGIVTGGIPRRITLELASLHGCRVFVETGTFQGETTRWASEHFEVVHTIERAETLYRRHRKELAALGGVTPHQGDSREILPRIVAELGNRRAVHWLDGHWSGGETAGVQDECPLLDELACLSGRSEDIILIDDARLFLGAPPSPHDPRQWPTILEVLEALPRSAGAPFVQVVDDVIFAVPDEEPLRRHLVDYTQTRATAALAEQHVSLARGSWFKTRLKRVLSRVRGSGP